MNTIIHGDCLDKLKELEDNSIDSIVTDPPYGLSFMGKKWDYDVPSEEVWKECLRVLKPGGYLLAFAGTRTQHRMAVRIEDAGFEIRDMIAWIYGSGFPKSLNVGKAVDKLQGNEKFKVKEIEFVRWLKSNLGSLLIEDIDKLLGLKNGAFHFFAESDSNRQIPNTEHYKKIKEYLHLDDDYDEFVKKHNLLLEEIRDVQGYEKSIKNWDKKYEKAILNKPKTELASEWEGWGTALKPALEPITVARKPLSEKTVAENCLKWGVGGINIDGSRVGTTGARNNGNSKGTEGSNSIGVYGKAIKQDYGMGRFPSNLIHDGSDDVVSLFPNTGKGNGGKPYNYAGIEYDNKDTSMFNGDKPQAPSNFNDSGSASRFFYCAKASKSERNKGCEDMEDKERVDYGGFHSEKGLIENNRNPENRLPNKNNHPTVKPIALMKYLVKLVSKEGAIVLDPFAGSGSTLVACKKLNRNYIGIEREADYIEIINKRLEI